MQYHSDSFVNGQKSDSFEHDTMEKIDNTHKRIHEIPRQSEMQMQISQSTMKYD